MLVTSAGWRVSFVVIYKIKHLFYNESVFSVAFER